MQSGVNYRERWKLSHVSHPCRALDTVSLVLWRSPLKRGLVLGIVRAEVQQKWAPAGGWLQIEAWVGEDGCREGRLAVGHGPQPADTDLEETHPPRALATSECRSRGRRVPTEEVQTERRSREKRTRKQRERGQECWVLIGQPGFPWPSRRTHLNFHDSLWQRWNTWTLMPSQIGYLDEWSNRGLKKKKKKSWPLWYRYASMTTKQWANSGRPPSRPKKHRQRRPWAPCTPSDGQAAPQNWRTASLEVPRSPRGPRCGTERLK